MATIHKPFKYTPALHTDITATFKRERARIRAAEARATADEEKQKAEEAAARAAKVTQLPVNRIGRGSG